jgi:predicted RNA-binding protein with PIN domain
MPYIIDGHNLIPKIPGLTLTAIDDEMQLVDLLLEFCRRRRKRIDVFFDKAPVGVPRSRNFGAVVARFVREGQTADHAIQKHLDRLGKQARNWTVVSSDKAVQSAARAAHAHYISAEVFAAEMLQALENNPPDPGASSDANLSPEEVDSWLDMFNPERDRDDGENKPAG